MSRGAIQRSAILVLCVACQPAVPPSMVSFSYLEQYPRRAAGIGEVRLNGSALPEGSVTLEYTTRVYIHVRPRTGMSFSKRQHYKWGGALPKEEAATLMRAFTGETTLTPAATGKPLLTVSFEDGTMQTGAPGDRLESTLKWLREHQEPYTPD